MPLFHDRRVAAAAKLASTNKAFNRHLRTPHADPNLFNCSQCKLLGNDWYQAKLEHGSTRFVTEKGRQKYINRGQI